MSPALKRHLMEHNLCGGYITLSAWRLAGRVLDQRLPASGPDGTVEVLVQVDPEEDDEPRWLHLAPGEYEIAE